MKRISHLMLASCVILSACDMDGLLTQPTTSPLKDPRDEENYHPLDMNLTSRTRDTRFESASLWPEGATAFFKDHRAAQVGDIITVLINTKGDSASLSNQTTLGRKQSEQVTLPNLLGVDLKKVFGKGTVPGSFVNATSNPSFTGTATIDRKEDIILKVAAVVTQVLGNGNLVIHGSQEILVNNEVRVLNLEGFIRRGDIAADNTIQHDRIAQARISYGGHGDNTRNQRERLGFRAMDYFSPL